MSAGPVLVSPNLALLLLPLIHLAPLGSLTTASVSKEISRDRESNQFHARLLMFALSTRSPSKLLISYLNSSYLLRQFDERVDLEGDLLSRESNQLHARLLM